MNNKATIEQMKIKLRVLKPTALTIADHSHLHVGHEGAKSGGGHFHLSIASDIFKNKNRIQCHRLIFACLSELMEKHIHALNITIIESPHYHEH